MTTPTNTTDHAATDIEVELADVLPDDASGDHTTTAPVQPQPNRAVRRATDATGGTWSRALKLNRAQLVPHYISAGLLAVAAALNQGVDPSNLAGAAFGAGVVVAGGAATLWYRAKRNDTIPDGWRTWFLTTTAAASLWIVYAVTAGVTPATLALLFAADATFGARWWKHHRLPTPDGPPPPPEPIQAPAPVVDTSMLATYPQRWAERLGGSGQILAGSKLLDGAPFEHGFKYTLKIVGGKHSFGDVSMYLDKIATALEWPQDKIMPEPPDGDNPALIPFTIMTTPPVQDSVFFTDPNCLRDGYIPLGPYADGIDTAAYRLYKKKRMLNGVVGGSVSSGKSRLLELIGLVAMFTGYTYVIHVDGMNGSSCPALWANAHETYGADEADYVLARLRGMQVHREQKLKERGFKPSPDYPGILVIVDEAHRLITDKTKNAWGDLAREINKCGMGILMADQDPSLQTFKNAVLRNNLKAGNCIGLRIDDVNIARCMGNGFDLSKLPKKPGTGFVFESDDPAARQATFRCQWLPDFDDVYPDYNEDTEQWGERNPAIPEDVTRIEEWFTQVPATVLDGGTAYAGDRPSQQVNAPTPATVRGGSQAYTTPSQSSATASTLTPFPTVPTPGATGDEGTTRDPVLDIDLTEPQERVLDAVRNGNTSPGAVAAVLDLGRQRVTQLLRELVDMELLDKTGNGPSVQYHPTV